MRDISNAVVQAAVERPAKTTARRILPDIGLVFGSALYLYLNLFTINGTPYLLDGDQVFFWVYAERLLNGEHIYRDFFQMTPPGTDLAFFSLFRLFGPRIWITNWVVLVLGVALCWLCFRVSLSLMQESSALSAAFLFLVLLFGKMLSATHHWFSALAVILAVAVLMKVINLVRIVAAGVFLGVASFFTQTTGLLATVGIAAFLALEWFEKKQPLRQGFGHLGALILSFAATWACLSSYWIATIGLHELLAFQITAAHRYVIHGWTISSLGIPQEDLAWRRLLVAGQYPFVYLLLPVVYAACAWKCWTRCDESLFPERERILLLTFAGSAMMLEVVQSPNWVRLYCVAMPAIILFIWWLRKHWKVQVGAAAVMWLGVLVLALHQMTARHHKQYAIAQLPGGTIATIPAKAEKLKWLAQLTRPGEFFFQPGWPGLYLPLRLRNPVFIDEFDTRGLTPAEYVDSSMRQLDAKAVRYILWSPRLDSPSPEKAATDNHLAPFREYLKENYEKVRSFPDSDQLWERKRSGQ
jgi:hypothetical protein